MINVKGISINEGPQVTSTTVTSVGPVGAAPNNNAAVITGNVLTLEPADGTHPGVVTSGTQTIGGNKTFSGTVSASNLSGTNTGDVTLAAVDSTPNANAASLSGQVLTLQPANTSFPGVLLAADWNTFNGKQPAGNYITALTGDVTASGPGSSAATIPNSTVTNSKMANMADQTIKGNNSGGSSAPQDLATSTVKTMLNLTGTNSGDVTLTAIGSTPNANAASLSGQALNLQPANGTFGGVVTAIAQSFAGLKTFVGNLISATVSGDSASGGNLTLQSTTNATKGFIKFGTSAYDENNNRLGIATATPAWTLDLEKTFSVATNLVQYGAFLQTTYGAADTNVKVGTLNSMVSTHTTGAIAGANAAIGNVSATGNGGTISTAVSFLASSTVSTGGTITTDVSFYASNATGAGTVGTQYGLYVEALSKASTDSFAIFTAGNNKSVMNGNVGIATNDPTNGNSIAGQARYLGITGDGTASGSATGILALSNNRATPTLLDVTGFISFASLNNGGGGANRVVAEIIGVLVGAGGANGMGGYLLFETKGDNVAGAPPVRMTIDNTGSVGIGTTTPAYPLDVTGNIASNSLGSGFRVKEGANAKMGSVALVGGTATVSTTAVTANSRIFLTSNADGGTPGTGMRVSSRTAGTSFVITSINVLDTSTVAWIIFEPS